jgi:HD superfamily phosphodiesterase
MNNKLDKTKEEIIQEIHNFVKSESEKSKVNEEISIFDYHIMNVVKFSEILAEEYNANKFVSIISAYLHDITFIQTSDHKTHEIEGEKFAREYLSKFSIPKEEIDLICLCILHHRGSKYSQKESIEEKILASADAMDHIDRCLMMFYRSGNKIFQDAFKFMQGKIARGWKKIELEKAREIIRAKYEAAKILFEIEES